MLRVLRGALSRGRGLVAVAVLAVAIGASVASALLHLSSDVGRKVGEELAAFGPNLVLAPRGEWDEPAPASPARAEDVVPDGFLGERDLAPLAAEPSVTWAPLLYVLGNTQGRTLRIVGSDAERLRALHPSWNAPAGRVWAGQALAKRLGIAAGTTLHVSVGDGDRAASWKVDGVLRAGGAEDEALWVPLADAQTLAGTPGLISAAHARVPGEPGQVETFARRFDASPRARATVRRALSATEGLLLGQMRQLMALVTVAALLAAVLCTFGTLSDLALERRREIALLKSLGAGWREVAQLFAAESVIIGALGGVLGWGIGYFFAQVIGRQVFHSLVGLNAWIPPAVVGLGLLTSLVAGVGPARWAMRLEPARVLKGE
jgi:putative ABC transport system permease protein